jgi:hypothetical protein
MAAQEFNRGKFKELVLLMTQKSVGDEGFGMVKLNKLLYRADFEAYRLLGHPITGEIYEKQEYGPVARDLPIVLDELAQEGRLTGWLFAPAGRFTRKVPLVSESQQDKPDTTQFSEAEKEIIRNTLSELAAHGGKSVSEWSHEQSAGWRAVALGAEIPYASAFISSEPLSDAQMQRALQRSDAEDWSSVIP